MNVQAPRTAALLEPIEQVLADRLDVDETCAIELGRLGEAALRRARTDHLANEPTLIARGLVDRVSLGHAAWMPRPAG